MLLQRVAGACCGNSISLSTVLVHRLRRNVPLYFLTRWLRVHYTYLFGRIHFFQLQKICDLPLYFVAARNNTRYTVKSDVLCCTDMQPYRKTCAAYIAIIIFCQFAHFSVQPVLLFSLIPYQSTNDPELSPFLHYYITSCRFIPKNILNLVF